MLTVKTTQQHMRYDSTSSISYLVGFFSALLVKVISFHWVQKDSFGVSSNVTVRSIFIIVFICNIFMLSCLPNFHKQSRKESNKIWYMIGGGFNYYYYVLTCIKKLYWSVKDELTLLDDSAIKQDLSKGHI